MFGKKEKIMKIGIVGCLGRMGKMLVNEVILNNETVLSGGTEQPGSSCLNRDLGIHITYQYHTIPEISCPFS